MARILAIFLLAVVIAQGIVLSNLWQRLGDATNERRAAEEQSRAARQSRDREIGALTARLQAAEARVAEFTRAPADGAPTPVGSVLLERNLGSQVAFTYGTPEEAGRYVGQTLQRLFAARRLQSPEAVEQSLKENELNILSMGPFIKDAEQLEANAAVFADFQSAVLGEVFAWDEPRRAQARELIHGLKSSLAGEEAGTDSWIAANAQATRQLLSLLSPDEQAARQLEIDFLTAYGVLLVPTYSLLTR